MILIIIKVGELLLWISAGIINAFEVGLKSRLHLVFSTHFPVFGYLMKHTSSCLIYYLLHRTPLRSRHIILFITHMIANGTELCSVLLPACTNGGNWSLPRDTREDSENEKFACLSQYRNNGAWPKYTQYKLFTWFYKVRWVIACRQMQTSVFHNYVHNDLRIRENKKTGCYLLRYDSFLLKCHLDHSQYWLCLD